VEGQERDGNSLQVLQGEDEREDQRCHQDNDSRPDRACPCPRRAPLGGRSRANFGRGTRRRLRVLRFTV
jgi:hypothetical protein